MNKRSKQLEPIGWTEEAEKEIEEAVLFDNDTQSIQCVGCVETANHHIDSEEAFQALLASISTHS